MVFYFNELRSQNDMANSKKIKRIPWNKGKRTGQLVWNKGKRGLQISWLKGKKGYTNAGSFKNGHRLWDHPNAIRTRFKKGQNTGNKFEKGFRPWNKGVKGYNAQEKHPQWKGGITPLNITIRNSFEGRLWREAIFKRDNYICQVCNKRGGNLHAHHIKQFALFPELRFAIDNGITLCVPCHKKISWRR